MTERYKQRNRNHLRNAIAVSALAFMLSLGGGAAMAQNKAFVGAAPPASNAKAIFIPTSAWLVGPISVQKPEDDKDMPCLMMNRFDNGFAVRISGTDKEVLAIAIDFRKALFDSGEGYDIKLKVGDYEKTLSAQAYDGSTLVMNTDHSADLFNQIETAKGMIITFGSTDLPFSLLSARDGMERLAACYSTPKSRNDNRVKEIEHSLREDIQEHSASATKAGGGHIEPIDAVHHDKPKPEVASVEKAEKKPATADNKKDETPRNQAAEKSNSKADDEDGAESAGAMLDDFLGGGSKATPAKSNAKPDVAETRPSFPAAAVPRPVIQEQTNPIGGTNLMKWEAQQGGNLKDILNIWTSHQKVGLLWALKGDYYLPRRFSYQGTFEDAVRAVMSEFTNEQYEPHAKLYSDPQSGKAYLLIGYEDGK